MAKKPQKPFKVLLGNRVAIASFLPDKPVEKKKDDDGSSIILLPKDQKELEDKLFEEAAFSTDRFVISQVGTDCSEHLKEGMEVDIENPKQWLAPERAHTIIEDDKVIAFIIPERAITGIY